MDTLAALLGIDVDSAEQRRAAELVRQDRELLRALIQVRIDKKITQEQVADRLGIKQPTVAEFERHDSDPKLSTIRRYAHAVGALVGHVVREDVGQLSESKEWITASFHSSLQMTAKPSGVPMRVPSIQADFGLVA